MADRRKTKDLGPPPPLLLLPASQSLTFTSEDGGPMPGILMPVPQTTRDTDGFTVCEFDAPSISEDDKDRSGTWPQLAEISSQPPTSTESLKASKSWNSFRMTGRPQYAVPSSPELSGILTTNDGEFPHSSSASFLPSSASASSSSCPDAMPSDAKSFLTSSSAPPTAGFIAPGTSSSKSQTQQQSASAVPPPGVGLAKYVPVTFHWFFCKSRDLRQIWEPLSFVDSINLEGIFRSGGADGSLVSTDGGRYDVDIPSRNRKAVYWDEPESKVRRCSWFYRNDGDSRLVPYDEDFADKLEEIYKQTLSRGEWHQKNDLPNGDTVILHSPTVIMHFVVPPAKAWNATALNDAHPRVVKRGTEDLDNIFEGESTQIDHLVFIVHGIGPTCDLRFRNIVECVDDFRTVSHQMLASHFKHHVEEELIGRIEYLPVRWHAALHGDATGIDRKLKAITLNSIGKLRQFTNDTLIDVLFYGSPAYAQKIADTVGNEINQLYQLFLNRNPDFKGGVSVAGHSLGSLILFDLLVHQRSLDSSDTQREDTPVATAAFDLSQTPTESLASDSDEADTKKTDAVQKDGVQAELTVDGVLSQLSLTDYVELFQREQIDIDTLMMIEDRDLKELGLPLGPRKKLFCFIGDQKRKRSNAKVDPNATSSNVEFPKTASEEISPDVMDMNDADPVLRSASSTSVNFVVGDAGTGIPFIHYPQLDFCPDNFFALGSPIAMFLTVRGVTSLGDDFRLPTCSGFFNIFHPFDPVAYRVEPMVTPSFPVKPVLMPHHKGRKRLHLELKESLSRVGSDLKHKVIESVKSTWRTINDFALAHRTPVAPTTPTPEDGPEKDEDGIMLDAAKDFDDSASICSAVGDDDYPIGVLNQGRRVDFVLQEKPIESFNEYLFALSSHGCYWDSEDTVLLILKEIYSLMGIRPQKPGPDPNQVPPPPTATSATFPRHPLRPTYAHPQQMTSPVMTPQTTSPAMTPPMAAPTTDTSSLPEEPGAPLPNFGPPPMTGFVRK